MIEKRKKIKKLEVMVADVVEDTNETTTLILFTGNDLLDYQPGHFLTIDPHQFEALERWTNYLEDKKGKKEKPRAYSLSSAPDEKYLSITVKEERYSRGRTMYPPLLSPILAKRTPKGTRMVITGFTGPYTLTEPVPETLVHICAGSGIVPNYSIMKYALRNYPDVKHKLLYSNRRWEDTIFGNELIQLQNEFPEQVELVFTFTREPKSGLPVTCYNRRVDQDMLKEIIPNKDDSIYVCGPGISVHEKKAAKKEGSTPSPRFLESVLADLEAIGVNKKNIKKESYG